MMTEEKARTTTECVNCGEPKNEGLVVCWTCFKYSPIPLKYFGGTFREWLEANLVRQVVDTNNLIAGGN